jgi:SAM-dependent methyltransferase
MNKEKIFKQYLNYFWLRPENAVQCALRSISLQDIKFKSPSVDISCGDGMFMFYHFGGQTNFDFDTFKSTQAKDFKHDKFVDIYNNVDENFTVEVTKKPKQQIDYGTDWKDSLLVKAKKLGIYKSTIWWDNNKIPLPFKDNYCKTIYNNSLHWIADPEPLITDTYRMLKPGGIAIFQAITPYQLETLDKTGRFLSMEAVSILNRQRRETMMGRRTNSEWCKLFTDCGFEIEQVKNVFPDKLLINLWNTGTRPVSHLLIQMVEQLSKEERHRIKEEWVDICFKLLYPLLSMPETYSLEKSPHLTYVLKK